jgi:hypothetical protein
MNHVVYPQYVEIMLVKELTLAGFRMDEDANHNENKAHKEGTLVGSLELKEDSSEVHQVPLVVASQGHLKMEVMLEIQVMG